MSTCLESSVDERAPWLRQAAEDGHAPAMHAFALQCDSHRNENDGFERLRTKGTSRPCTIMG